MAALMSVPGLVDDHVHSLPEIGSVGMTGPQNGERVRTNPLLSPRMVEKNLVAADGTQRAQSRLFQWDILPQSFQDSVRLEQGIESFATRSVELTATRKGPLAKAFAWHKPLSGTSIAMDTMNTGILMCISSRMRTCRIDVIAEDVVKAAITGVQLQSCLGDTSHRILFLFCSTYVNGLHESAGHWTHASRETRPDRIFR